MIEVASIVDLVAAADVIISICPPGDAETVAHSVAETDFGGLYVDANAIAPETAKTIAPLFDRFVDGSVVGPPVTPRAASNTDDGPQRSTTRLYLSGDPADTALVASLWEHGNLECRVVGELPGAASAVKMCFASWTKIGSALLLDVLALADSEGVTGALLAEWETSMPEMVERSNRQGAAVAPKAWRFVGEMEQIAAAYRHADLPDGFAVGAAEIYQRLAHFAPSDTPAAGLADESTSRQAVIDALRRMV